MKGTASKIGPMLLTTLHLGEHLSTSLKFFVKWYFFDIIITILDVIWPSISLFFHIQCSFFFNLMMPEKIMAAKTKAAQTKTEDQVNAVQ